MSAHINTPENTPETAPENSPGTAPEAGRTGAEVVIIGGGAAGLSAAQALGRARRSVVLIDAGEPRNAPASGVHNVLSRDGMPPLALVAAGRAELAAYNVEILRTRAVDTRRAGAREGEGFIVSLEGGREIAARHVVLAAGVRDRLPEVEGLAAHWGAGVLHCPHCHGWEVRDLRIGVLDSPHALHQALMFPQWSPRVTLFARPGLAPTGEDRERLEALGVAIVEGEVRRVLGERGALAGVELADGARHALDALVVMPVVDVDLSCVASLSLAPAELPNGQGRYVPVDAEGRSAIPGLWAAGGVAQPMAQVMPAAAAGMGVGQRINAELSAADLRLAVEARRARSAPARPRLP